MFTVGPSRARDYRPRVNSRVYVQTTFVYSFVGFRQQHFTEAVSAIHAELLSLLSVYRCQVNEKTSRWMWWFLFLIPNVRRLGTSRCELHWRIQTPQLGSNTPLPFPPLPFTSLSPRLPLPLPFPPLRSRPLKYSYD